MKLRILTIIFFLSVSSLFATKGLNEEDDAMQRMFTEHRSHAYDRRSNAQNNRNHNRQRMHMVIRQNGMQNKEELKDQIDDLQDRLEELEEKLENND